MDRVCIIEWVRHDAGDEKQSLRHSEKPGEPDAVDLLGRRRQVLALTEPKGGNERRRHEITPRLASGTNRGNGTAKRSGQGRRGRAAVCQIFLLECCHGARSWKETHSGGFRMRSDRNDWSMSVFHVVPQRLSEVSVSRRNGLYPKSRAFKTSRSQHGRIPTLDDVIILDVALPDLVAGLERHGVGAAGNRRPVASQGISALLALAINV